MEPDGEAESVRCVRVWDGRGRPRLGGENTSFPHLSCLLWEPQDSDLELADLQAVSDQHLCIARGKPFPASANG